MCGFRMSVGQSSVSKSTIRSPSRDFIDPTDRSSYLSLVTTSLDKLLDLIEAKLELDDKELL